MHPVPGLPPGPSLWRLPQGRRQPRDRRTGGFDRIDSGLHQIRPRKKKDEKESVLAIGDSSTCAAFNRLAIIWQRLVWGSPRANTNTFGPQPIHPWPVYSSSSVHGRMTRVGGGRPPGTGMPLSSSTGCGRRCRSRRLWAAPPTRSQPQQPPPQ